MSSAYSNILMHIPFRKLENLLSLTFRITPSIYIAKRYGDKTPPCLIPQDRPKNLACDGFLVALSDTEFELKIREHEPANLDDVLRISRRFEVFKGAVESRAT